MVLECGHADDQRGGVVAECLADELERVAQPLAGDAQLVERLDVGPAQDGLVAADLLVGRPDPRRGRIADAVRLGGQDRHDRGAIGPDEITIVVDPASVAIGVELADQQDPGIVAMLVPVPQQRFERSLFGDRHVGAIDVGGLEQDV